jgi:two-component system sensor histidine kinase BaeS
MSTAAGRPPSDVPRARYPESSRERAVADLSHEMRAPLLSIVARAERLRDHADPAVGREALELRAAGLAVLAQLDELRDLSRLARRRTRVRLGDCDLVAVLEAVVGQFFPVAEALGIDLRLEAPLALPTRIDVDKVVSIASNLLGNAIRHAPEHGAVRCSVRLDGGEVLLEVADSGAGIPPEHRPLVFRRAWRGPEDAAGSGRGIGLAIVRELVLLHGGAITVDTAPEGGALLSVRLPHAPALGAPRGATVAEAAGRRLATERVVADLELLVGRR